jgi:carbonic anhydrase/acetyltransferase-like protein (isoleucine patch superfamily)
MVQKKANSLLFNLAVNVSIKVNLNTVFNKLTKLSTILLFYATFIRVMDCFSSQHAAGDFMSNIKLSNNLRSYKGILPTLGANNYIDMSAVIVGDIILANDVSIWPLVAARGDVNSISIGARTNIQDGSVLHVTRKSQHNPKGNPLIIGEDVTVGHKCMLHGCTLGNRILVGMGAIIMDGTIVEDDVFIGAGTVVPPNKTLKSGYLYVGNPMKQVRKLKESETAFLKQSALNYLELKNDYLNEDY